MKRIILLICSVYALIMFALIACTRNDDNTHGAVVNQQEQLVFFTNELMSFASTLEDDLTKQDIVELAQIMKHLSPILKEIVLSNYLSKAALEMLPSYHDFTDLSFYDLLIIWDWMVNNEPDDMWSLLYSAGILDHIAYTFSLEDTEFLGGTASYIHDIKYNSEVVEMALKSLGYINK